MRDGGIHGKRVGVVRICVSSAMADLLQKGLEKLGSVCNARWRNSLTKSWSCEGPCEIRHGWLKEKIAGEVRFRVQSAMVEFIRKNMES